MPRNCALLPGEQSDQVVPGNEGSGQLVHERGGNRRWPGETCVVLTVNYLNQHRLSARVSNARIRAQQRAGPRPPELHEPARALSKHRLRPRVPPPLSGFDHRYGRIVSILDSFTHP